MTEPLATDLHAVWIHASDLDRSVHFYRDLLGIPLERQDEVWWCATMPSGVTLIVEQAHGLSPQVPGTLGITFRCADLAATGRRLEAAGQALHELPAGVDFIEVSDPDGYAIVFEAG